MSETDEQLYQQLIEAAARITAWEGVTDVLLPPVAHALASEAVDLRGGWKNFDENGDPGTQPLPIVDAVADEVFRRANALRKEFIAKIVAQSQAAADAVRELKPDDTRH